MTTVFRISSTGFRSSASVSSFSSRPSERAGIRMIPSALVREVMTPEPLGKGDAKNFSPIFPTFTLRNSSVPNLEGIFRVGEGLDSWSFWFCQMEGLIEDGSNQFFIGDDGRNRVTRNSDDGPILESCPEASVFRASWKPHGQGLLRILQ